MERPLSFLFLFFFLFSFAQEKEYSFRELRKELNNKTFIALISESCAEPIGMKYTYCQITFIKNKVNIVYTLQINETVMSASSTPRKYKWKLLKNKEISIIDFKDYGNFIYSKNELLGEKKFIQIN